MSQTSVDLDHGRRLAVEPERHSLRLYPAIGGARVEIRLRTTLTGEAKEQLALETTATLKVSTNPSVNRQVLCELQAPALLTPHAQGATQLNLEGMVSSEQLRLVEELRG